MNQSERIQTAQIHAAEDEVIAGIPPSLLEALKAAQRRHEANGGCPGCGCLTFACHVGNCPTLADDCY